MVGTRYVGFVRDKCTPTIYAKCTYRSPDLCYIIITRVKRESTCTRHTLRSSYQSVFPLTKTNWKTWQLVHLPVRIFTSSFLYNHIVQITMYCTTMTTCDVTRRHASLGGGQAVHALCFVVESRHLLTHGGRVWRSVHRPVTSRARLRSTKQHIICVRFY